MLHVLSPSVTSEAFRITSYYFALFHLQQTCFYKTHRESGNITNEVLPPYLTSYKAQNVTMKHSWSKASSLFYSVFMITISKVITVDHMSVTSWHHELVSALKKIIKSFMDLDWVKCRLESRSGCFYELWDTPRLGFINRGRVHRKRWQLRSSAFYKGK